MRAAIGIYLGWCLYQRQRELEQECTCETCADARWEPLW